MTDVDVQALSLWQPWASLMAYGAKWVETRGYATRYRGTVLLCSTAKSPDGPLPRGLVAVGRPGIDRHPFLTWRAGHDDLVEIPAPLPAGKVLAVGRLAACVPFVAPGPITLDTLTERERSGFVCVDVDERRGAYYRPGIAPDELSVDVSGQIPLGDFTPGRFGWIFEDVRRLDTPVPIRGRQRLFRPTLEVVEQVAAQVPLAA